MDLPETGPVRQALSQTRVRDLLAQPTTPLRSSLRQPQNDAKNVLPAFADRPLTKIIVIKFDIRCGHRTMYPDRYRINRDHRRYIHRAMICYAVCSAAALLKLANVSAG